MHFVTSVVETKCRLCFTPDSWAKCFKIQGYFLSAPDQHSLEMSQEPLLRLFIYGCLWLLPLVTSDYILLHIATHCYGFDTTCRSELFRTLHKQTLHHLWPCWVPCASLKNSKCCGRRCSRPVMLSQKSVVVVIHFISLPPFSTL